MKPTGIRGQLIALVLAAMLPLAGLLAWSLHAEAEREAQLARDHVLQLAEFTASETARFLGQAQNILNGLAARPAVRALDPSGCDPVLKDFLALAPRFSNVVTLRMDGEVVCSAVPVAGRLRLDPESLVKRLRGPGELTVGRATPGTITGRWAVPVGRPLLDAQGAAAGAVSVTIDLLRLSTLPKVEGLPAGAVAGVVDAEGTVLAHSGDPARFVGTNNRERPETRRMLAEKRGVAEEKGLDGTLRIRGYTPVPGTDWIAVASLSAAEVYSPARARTLRGALFALAVIAVALLLAAYWSRRLREPVLALADTADEVARGNLAARAPVGGTLEIAEVASQFNHMLDALRHSEARFRTVFMAASTPMSIASERTGALLSVNDAYCAYFGYAREEVLGRTSVELGLWTDPAECADITNRLHAAGRVHDYLARRRLRSGEVREVLMSVDLLELEGERCTLALLQDVTERRRANRERAAALEQFQKIFHAAPLATSITTLDGGRLVEVNAAFCALAGRKREELIGQSVPGLGIWVDLRERDAYVARLRRDGRVASFEARIRSAGGEQRALLGSAEVVDFLDERCIMMTGTDITERKQTAARLEQQLDELRRWYQATLGREGRVLQLKREVNELLARAGQPARYSSPASADERASEPPAKVT